ncbi:MAG: MotA/TolQ/ExbB proton channel family protein [Candidatus Scalinduaceae bacterium]
MRGIGVTLWQMAVQGGPVMIPIAILSIFVVALGVYCSFAVRINAIAPKNFILDVIRDVKLGKIRNAINMCQSSVPYMGGVLLSGLLKADSYMNPKNQGDSKKVDITFYITGFSGIREIVEAEGSRLASRLRQRVAWFSHVGIIAPMFGLLGTVFGMIRAFSSIAYKVEFGKPLLLASAISEAMVTTAGGLTVGIFSMILFFYFHSKTNNIIYEMEAGSEGVVDAINVAMSNLNPAAQTAPSKKDDRP